ncbi:MAG TPA: hypothetical protein VEB39_04135 [Sphingomicrobium sp.]|nr:hypothetical protein [Sphingomicrobium sp.]
MKLLVAATALLLTAAVPVPSRAERPAPSYDWKLTPAGWGPVRIGMSREQVTKALQVELQGDAFDNQGSCIELFPASEELKGIYFMFQDGKLSRISVVETGKITTPRGIRVGATADEVRAAYGDKLQTEPHHYIDLPAEYLTYWLRPKARGVRFETDAQRKVETIHAGNDSIQLVEGCA